MNKYILILLFFCNCFSSYAEKVPLEAKDQEYFNGVSDQNNKAFKKLDIKGLINSVDVVACGTLEGFNQDNLILGNDSLIFIYQVQKEYATLLYTTAFEGEIKEIAIGDADNDGLNEIVIATGSSRKSKDPQIRIYVIQYKNEKWDCSEIYKQASTRPDVTFVKITDMDYDGKNEIVLSCFKSKYFTQTLIVSKKQNAWNISTLLEDRMAMSYDIGSLPNFEQDHLLVGRPYGDEIGDVGDAYIYVEGKKIMLPVFRGVKSLKIGDGDNDGKNEIYVGDGWHQDYGKIARGRIAVLHADGRSYNYKLIEDVKRQFDTRQIEIADITGDGVNELITCGSSFFRIYKFYDNQWNVFCNPEIPHTQFAIGDINGDKFPDVIFAGDRNDGNVKIYNFINPSYHSNLDKELVTEVVAPESLIGKKAPELRMQKWFNGNFSSIEDNKGKLILLDFWATWCVPCKKSFPKLRLLQEKYAKDGLLIIGVTRLDRTQTLEKVEGFVNKEKFNYPIGVSEESLNNLFYGVGGIPHVVLIDRNGVVRYYEVGYNDGKNLEQQIIELLK